MEDKLIFTIENLKNIGINLEIQSEKNMYYMRNAIRVYLDLLLFRIGFGNVATEYWIGLDR